MTVVDLDVIERAYGGNYVGEPWIPSLISEVRELRDELLRMYAEHPCCADPELAVKLQEA